MLQHSISARVGGAVLVVGLAVLVAMTPASANAQIRGSRGGGGARGGGGMRGGGMSRPSGGARPSASRPANVQRPQAAQRPANVQRPTNVQRPSNVSSAQVQQRATAGYGAVGQKGST